MSYEDMQWHVYLIKNKANGKGYVGITVKDADVRLNEHFSDHQPAPCMRFMRQ